ncbi:putative longevity-assurance protein-like protein [Papiliotrema laurentii]|uniref:Longevity-assurance protein-like protein n=1 Tax=Papiliotrema laurentii TaxID=5418 RepID=A0AAD9L5T8_PAPLA|nr:putative longevity-assurance protein-like protein [Papiliotrema laurentii]
MSATSTYIHSFLPEALHPFVSLSYPVAPIQTPLTKLRLHPARKRDPTAQQLYGQGPKDVYFVVFCALAFTLLREICLRYVLSAFARRWLLRARRREQAAKDETSRRPMTKLEKRKMEHTVTRFAEQGWSFLYCTTYWLLGGYILSRIPAPFSPESIWATYPNTHLPPLTKFYYLSQLGWWFHQLYVINTEKRRNDHWQMFGHHILTIVLITGSYIAHFTRIGTILHFLMDLCDIFLPLAKMLRYLSLTTLCDLTFVVFLVAWLFSRQIGLALVIRTCYHDAPRFIPFKWDPSQGMYLTQGTYYGFISLIVVLFVLASIWFYMACSVAVRVIRGLGAEDSRSDDEGDEEGEKDVLDQVPESASASVTGQNGAAVRRRRK